MPAQQISMVRLTFCDFQLLLPQSDVRSVEPIGEVQRLCPAPSGVGEIRLGGHIWSIFALTNTLELCASATSDRVCVLFDPEDYGFGLTCVSFEPHSVRPHEIQAVPECMASANGVIHELVVMDDNVVGVTTALQLACHLQGAGNVATVAGATHPAPA